MTARWQLTPLTLLCAFLVLLSCKSDKKIVGPDGQDPGAYRLEVRAGNDTLRYGIENRIVVRLYRGSAMAVNDTLLLRTESAIGFLDETLVIPQSDTVAHPCGSNPCTDYICEDTNIGKDTVFGYAIADGETVATASASFFLAP